MNDMSITADMCGLNFFTVEKEGGALWFVHERDETTGVCCVTKQDLSDLVMRFSVAQAVNRHLSLVAWAGKQNHRVLGVLSEEARRARQAKESSKKKNDK